MKKVHFAKRWKHVISATSYAMYPADAEVIVADHVAAIAFRDGALKGEPVDAPEEPAKGDPAAAKKTKAG